MKIQWSAWTSPPVLIGLLILGYTVVYRIPDLERRTERLDGDVREQLKLMNLSLIGLRANVMRLCGQQRPQLCKVEELVAEAKSVTRVQAEFFDAAKVSLRTGAQPAVASEGIAEQLPWVAWASIGYGKADKAELANLILWSSAADSARWRREGNTVKADFANGVASFDVARPISNERMTELVNSLNATSAALQVTQAHDTG